MNIQQHIRSYLFQNRETSSFISGMFFLLAFALLFCVPLAYSDSRVSIGGRESVFLGSGFDLNKREFKGECIQGQIEEEGKQISGLRFHRSIGQKELSRHLGLEVGDRARIGVIDTSISSKFLNDLRTDQYSAVLVYVGDYTFKDRFLTTPYKLTPVGETFQKSISDWIEVCGDEYVYRQEIGGKIFISLRIDFTSEEERKYFDHNFSNASSLFSEKEDIDRFTKSFSKGTRMTVNGLQIGGKVEKFRELFHQLHNPSNGPVDAIQCSLGQFNQCAAAFVRAMTYATDVKDGFPSQLARSKDSEDGGGPALLAVYTRPYEQAGIQWGRSPEFDHENRAARATISQLFEKNYDAYAQATRLTQWPVGRLSLRQKTLVVDAQKVLFDNLKILADASLQCFDFPTTCMSQLQILRGNASDPSAKVSNNDFLTRFFDWSWIFRNHTESQIDEQQSLPGKRVVEIDPSIFKIQPESFMQYCDLGLSVNSSRPLRDTIRAFIGLAKSISPDDFVISNGDEKDICHITDQILKNQKSLNLSKRKILVTENGVNIEYSLYFPDLRVIETLSGLESVDLRENDIEDISALKGAVQIKKLNLSRNRISDVSALSQLTQLEELDLSNNRLRSVDGLGRLLQLKHLDLRNNGRNITCPLADPSRCLTEDYSRGYSFSDVEIPELVNASGNVNLDVLPSGEIFLQGAGTPEGCSLYRPGVQPPKYHRVQLLDPNLNHVQDLDSDVISQDRQVLMSMKSVSLLDGNVLLVGGELRRYSSDFQSFFSIYGTAWLYDRNIGRLVMLDISPSMKQQLMRIHAEVIRLQDGKVWVSGGRHPDNLNALKSTLLFDPETRTFSQGPELLQGRAYHAGLLLESGHVLITGGMVDLSVLDSAELYDPSNGRISRTRSPMHEKRMAHQMTFLGGHQVLITGSSRHAELFDTEALEFHEISNLMSASRTNHQATRLDDQRILITGGQGTSLNGLPDPSHILRSAEIYNTIQQRFHPIGPAMKAARALHRAIVLPERRVLLVGGADGDGPAAEIMMYP